MSRALVNEWTPARLGGGKIKFWYRPDLLPVVADGTAIAALPDSSVNALYPLAQATAGNRPTYRVNVQNGKPSIRFVGSSFQFLQRATGPQHKWVAAVFSFTNGANFDAAWNHLLSSPAAGAGGFLGIGSSTTINNNGNIYVNNGAATASPTAVSLAPLSTFHAVIDENVGTYNLSTGMVLGRNGTAGAGYTGDLLEMIGGNTVLNTLERDLLFRYFNDKFAVY